MSTTQRGVWRQVIQCPCEGLFYYEDVKSKDWKCPKCGERLSAPASKKQLVLAESLGIDRPELLSAFEINTAIDRAIKKQQTERASRNAEAAMESMQSDDVANEHALIKRGDIIMKMVAQTFDDLDRARINAPINERAELNRIYSAFKEKINEKIRDWKIRRCQTLVSFILPK